MFKKLFLLLAALIAANSNVRSAEKEVKIGFISAFTGVFSSFGQQQKEGAVLALEEANYTAAGDKISVIYEDDQLDNEQAVTKAKKLVVQDKIDILTGLVSGDEGLSVGDYMKDKNIPVLPMYSASEDMTMRAFYPMIVRATWTGAQSMDVFGYWLAKVKGWKKIYAIGEDTLTRTTRAAVSSAAFFVAAARKSRPFGTQSGRRRISPQSSPPSPRIRVMTPSSTMAQVATR